VTLSIETAKQERQRTLTWGLEEAEDSDKYFVNKCANKDLNFSRYLLLGRVKSKVEEADIPVMKNARHEIHSVPACCVPSPLCCCGKIGDNNIF
jgi:hypothetical protein